MHIRFGLQLDGQRGWQARDTLGEAVVGPLGLLDILETHLGLLADRPSPSERIVQYRNCLTLCDKISRFYHRSFTLDELGTAATLLSWRDAWHLHGWSGSGEPDARRLRDMTEVEEQARGRLAPSVGERLAAVAEALAERKVPIAELRLLDPMERFPVRWQAVLKQLPTQADTAFIPQPGAGFLGKLQARLADAHDDAKTDKPLPWRADGSVTVVRAESEFLAGQWLAARMASGADDTLLVAPAAGERLDGLFVAAGLPRQGLREPSAFRPALQVLPLALDLIWEPLNFPALLQFLTHPVCPVRLAARRRIAEKIAQAPGIQGEAWETMLAKIAEHYGGDDAQEAQTVRSQIRAWVEHPRHDAEAGADIGEVIERVEALANWFHRRLADEDSTSRIAFASGHSQCRSTMEALKALRDQGMERVYPRQLQKLVAQATAQGSENPMLQAEVGARLLVTQPGAAIEPCRRVVWWQMALPPLPRAWPWSRAEIAELAQQGALLPTASDLLEQAAADWLRPILAAGEELVLVLPPKDQEVHPLWQMIEALVDEVPIGALEDLLTRPEDGMVAVTHRPLPARKRFWQLPPDTPIPARERDSFSSLEMMLFNPHQWLLKYPAELAPSRSLSLPGDFLLYGNLAHGLVERLFREAKPLDMPPAAFETWFETWFKEAFDQLLAEEGAILLMPGRKSDLESFRIKLRRAVKELRRQLAQAKVTGITPEMELEGSYRGGKLIGYADIVAQKTKGGSAIIDMKWAGMKKYPDKLKTNTALQLAIYAQLLKQKTGAWPALAYFILEPGKLLATGNDWFPDAEVVRNEKDENTAQLWERFLATRKWRQTQFKEGRFEVVLEGIPEEDESESPEEGLKTETLNEAYNEHLALAGWEE